MKLEVAPAKTMAEVQEGHCCLQMKWAVDPMPAPLMKWVAEAHIVLPG